MVLRNLVRSRQHHFSHRCTPLVATRAAILGATGWLDISRRRRQLEPVSHASRDERRWPLARWNDEESLVVLGSRACQTAHLVTDSMDGSVTRLSRNGEGQKEKGPCGETARPWKLLWCPLDATQRCATSNGQAPPPGTSLMNRMPHITFSSLPPADGVVKGSRPPHVCAINYAASSSAIVGSFSNAIPGSAAVPRRSTVAARTTATARRPAPIPNTRW